MQWGKAFEELVTIYRCQHDHRFLIRYLRDGDFYIAEFTGGIIGIVIAIAGFLKEFRKA